MIRVLGSTDKEEVEEMVMLEKNRRWWWRARKRRWCTKFSGDENQYH